MSDNQPNPNNGFDPEDLQRLMREMFGADGSITPEEIAKATGIPLSTAQLNHAMMAFQRAMSGEQVEINWDNTREVALQTIRESDKPDADSAKLISGMENASQAAITLATLWLDEVTTMGTTADAPRLLTREQWVEQSLNTWIELAKPVAESMADALESGMKEQLPEEIAENLPQLAGVTRNIGGALFAMQLGSAVGQLACQVVSGGDIGIPLITGEGHTGGALLPENMSLFANDLDQSPQDVALYLTVRELAHARLFKHAKWLRTDFIRAITDYAREIEFNITMLDAVNDSFDPTQQEQLQEMISSGALIPPKTAAQEAAHERLETTLALIEGWVDAVTAKATEKLPGAESIAEMVRRRRATGGPAEKTFGTLIGLELRPQKLREAAKMWQLLAERGGDKARDELWSHPDLLPTAEEIEHPAKLLERLGLAGQRPEELSDDIDIALERLLAGEFDRPGDAGEAGDAGDAGGSNGAGDAVGGEHDGDGEGGSTQANP